MVVGSAATNGAMFSEHFGRADEGCDFDFLESQARIAEPEIH